ncbi:MAG TPA: hypothetical protein VIV40_21290 [Kofleriaceae bacterium]
MLLIPKCPLCIAAYAASLGLGLSIAAAAAVRTVLIVVCVGVLLAIIARTASAWYRETT